MDADDPDGPDRDTDSALDGAADEILDGRPIDWRQLATEDGSDPKPELGALHILESVAALHRRAASEPETWGWLRLLERVAGGAFGDVYRAWDARLDREVALKLLRAPDAASDPSDSVIEEGRLLARVRHPNVMTVYGAERIGDRIGVWTEFIHGRTLADLVRAQGSFTTEETVRIGHGLCLALAAVHGAGLIHRDIKAANVMREETGRVVLMDFGAGREQVMVAVASSRELTGTPLYLAPELWEGAATTPQSDLYSVGVLLYHLVTGAYPVHGTTAAEVREAHRLNRRRRLSEARPDLPARFAALVDCATDVDPSKRIASAETFAEALQELLPVEPTARRARQWRAGAISIGVLAIGVASWAWWFGPRNAQKRSGIACTNCFSAASLSDDGRWLVDVDSRTGDLTIRDLSTSGSPRHLGLRTDPVSSSNFSYAERPVISKDDKWIAYRWRPDRRSAPELRVVNREGAPQPRTILAGTAFEAEPDDWSADGSRVLVTVHGPGRPAGFAWVDTARRTIDMIASIDLEAAFVDTRPRLSPDDRLIAYTAHRNVAPLVANSAVDNALHIIAVREQRDTVVDLPASMKGAPVWTPDGRAILFISNQSGTFDLWSLDVTGGRAAASPSLVSANVGDDVGLTSTSDGVYYRARFLNDTLSVQIGDLAGPAPFAGPMRVTKTLPGANARLSSDGRVIEYSNGAELMVYTLSTAENRRVLRDLPRDAPLWLQQSRFILASTQDPSTLAWTLRSIDAATGDSTTSHLPPMSIGVAWGVASLDGRTLFAPARDLSPGLPRVAGFDRIVAIDLATARSTVIWRLPASEPRELFSLTLSPDGRSLAFVRTKLTGSQGWLARVDIDARHFQALVGPYDSVFPWEKVSWRADTILYGSFVSRTRWAIMRVPASGGAPAPTGLEFDGYGSKATFDFSPDGRHIVFHPGPEPPVTRDEVWRLDLQALGR